MALDLAGWLLLIAFEGIVGGVALLLSLTYLSFRRMAREVRRARMFIMSDRIQRFLGAFTVGFIVLAATFATGFLGIVLPAGVGAGAFFFFLAMVAYGVVELFFIIRPRRTKGIRRRTTKAATAARILAPSDRLETAEEEPNASR